MEKEKAAPAIDEIGKQVRDNFGQIRDVVTERGTELRDKAVSFIDEHPYAAIGMAFGVGYLLSGALVSRTTGRVLMYGGKLLVGGLLKSLIAGGALGALAPLVQQMTAEPESASEE